MNASCSDCEGTSETMSVLSIIIVIAQLILMVVICGGNFLTIRAVWKTSKLNTIPNQYIVSLACADFLAGLMLPYQASGQFPGVQTIIDNNKFLCLCRHVAFFLSLGQTIQCITVIALDRTFFIGFPMHYQRLVTFYRTRVLIIWTWTFAVVLGTIPLYYNNWHPGVRCSYFLVIPFYYQSLIQTTIFVLFSFINAGCYGYIFYIARKQQKLINRQIAAVDATRQATNMKAVKMFLTVFGIFFICLSPGILCMNLGHTIGLPNGVVDITIILAFCNSGMNFFIYAAKNSDFNAAFRKMLGIPRKREVSPINHDHQNNRNQSK